MVSRCSERRIFAPIPLCNFAESDCDIFSDASGGDVENWALVETKCSNLKKKFNRTTWNHSLESDAVRCWDTDKNHINNQKTCLCYKLAKTMKKTEIELSSRRNAENRRGARWYQVKQNARSRMRTFAKSGVSLQREANFHHNCLVPLHWKWFWPSLAGRKWLIMKIELSSTRNAIFSKEKSFQLLSTTSANVIGSGAGIPIKTI